MSEHGAISPERDEIVGERGAELSGAVCCDSERWSGGANTHVSGEREFSPLSSAHMLWYTHRPARERAHQCASIGSAARDSLGKNVSKEVCFWL